MKQLPSPGIVGKRDLEKQEEETITSWKRNEALERNGKVDLKEETKIAASEKVIRTKHPVVDNLTDEKSDVDKPERKLNK
jgi:hypothetical protein